MAKKSATNLFLEKGDKLILGVGVTVTALLLFLAASTLTGAPSTAETIKKLEGEAQRVTREVNNTTSGEVPELPAWAITPAGYKLASADQFPIITPPFEPVYQPDMRRENPRVVDPVAGQLDFVRGPMRANDVKLDASGEVLIGVLVNKPVEETNLQKVREATKALASQTMAARERSNRIQQQRQAQSAQPAALPGAPPGSGSPRGGIRGGGPPGGFDPSEMLPPGAGGPGGIGGFASTRRDDQTVRYMSPADAEQNGNALAETIVPLEAVLVQAAFPLKEQLREIRRALRLRSDEEAAQQAMAVGTQGGFGPGRPPIPGAAMMSNPFGNEEMLNMSGGPPAWLNTGTGFGQTVGIQFAGFDVQRRYITPSGEQTDWELFPHEDFYHTRIGWYSLYAEEDDNYLYPFLQYEQRMSAPLPGFAEGLGRYPGVRIPEIVNAIKRLKESNLPVPTPSDFEQRFSKTAGDNNPYLPRSRGASSGVTAGSFGPPGAAFGGPGGPGGPFGAPARGPAGRGGQFGAPQPGAAVPPIGGPGGPFGASQPGRGGQPFGGPGRGPGGGPFQPGQGVPGLVPPPEAGIDYTLIRFFDPDVEPGYTYEYRIRVKVYNPNFGKKGEVQNQGDAEKEILEGNWWKVPGSITVPTDFHLYAFDAGEYVKKAEELVKEVGRVSSNQLVMRGILEVKEVQEGRRAVVQVQQWLPQVRASGSNFEPVGTWVVAELPAAPGEYIGRRQLVKLPLWSASAASYVLRELTGGVRVARIQGEGNQPRGWPVVFRTNSLLVDFEGGMTRAQVGNRDIRDESTAELLILEPDGKLRVLNSAQDMADRKRAERDKAWTDWIDRVKNRLTADASPFPGGPGGPPVAPGGRFNRGE